ncbi:beta-ketoacyl synthase domain-containing protein [Penicillium malachiteum]|nr:beta-ketoacyl synthase domain-containing protein [Penicillium malachiteum]
MCPTMISVQQLPRTVSGKLDRNSVQGLPVQSSIPSNSNVENQSKLQARMKQLWLSVIPSKLVGAEHIDRRTDFFHGGGDSMLLMDLHRSVKNEFHSSVSLLQLFQHSTLEGISSLLSLNEADSPTSENIVHGRDAINWDIETAPSIRDAPLCEMTVHPLGPLPRIILLTSATGLLGQHLLELLNCNRKLAKSPALLFVS